MGVREAIEQNLEFYFLLLDLAPWQKLLPLKPRASKSLAIATKASGFPDKWLTAWWFNYYKRGRNGSLKPIKEVLDGICDGRTAEKVAKNMGWLTWADVFKVVLRAVIDSSPAIESPMIDVPSPP